MKSQNSSLNTTSNNSSNLNNSNLDSIKINYYPLLPFLSYDNTYNSSNQNFGQDILNDFTKLKNYIKALNERKSWQQFSSFIISNIENANKKIVYKNDINNLIGNKRKSTNKEKNLENKTNINYKYLKNKIIEKKDINNENNEKFINHETKKSDKSIKLKLKNISKNGKKNKNMEENNEQKIKEGKEISIVIKVPKCEKRKSLKSTECIYQED